MLSLGTRPYRLVISAHGFRVGRRFKNRTELIPTEYGFFGWNPVQHYQEARLPNAGSFYYPGFIRARQAAYEYLKLAHVTQVSVRTDQDRTVLRYVKHRDGIHVVHDGDC